MKFYNAGKYIKELRNKSGLTQQQLGKKIGQHSQMCSNVERSMCFYPKKVVTKLVKVLNLDIHQKHTLLVFLQEDYKKHAEKTFGKLLK